MYIICVFFFLRIYFLLLCTTLLCVHFLYFTSCTNLILTFTSSSSFFVVFFVSSVRLVELRRAALLAAGEVWKLQFGPKGVRSRLLRGWWRAQGRVCGGLKWNVPANKLLLSPHTADLTEDYWPQSVQAFRDNLLRMTAGKPLCATVNLHAGY